MPTILRKHHCSVSYSDSFILWTKLYSYSRGNAYDKKKSKIYVESLKLTVSLTYINYICLNSSLKERSGIFPTLQANKIDEKSQGQSEFFIIQVGNLLEDVFQKWEKDINTSKERKVSLYPLSYPIFMVRR